MQGCVEAEWSDLKVQVIISGFPGIVIVDIAATCLSALTQTLIAYCSS